MKPNFQFDWLSVTHNAERSSMKHIFLPDGGAHRSVVQPLACGTEMPETTVYLVGNRTKLRVRRNAVACLEYVNRMDAAIAPTQTSPKSVKKKMAIQCILYRFSLSSDKPTL